jgi:peptidase S24-like protein
VVEQRHHWLPYARRATFEVYRRQGDSMWVQAQGGSMRPLIEPGSWMLVEFGAAAAEVGQIVLFPQGERIVAHRVVAQRTRLGTPLLLTKGDAEPYCDPPLVPAEVLGVVRALRRPDAPATCAGCRGFSARVVARMSWWGSRGAALARRMAALLPDPLRRIVARAIPPFARVAAWVLFAPLSWAARIQVSPTHGDERR